ncbi:MAG: hypothetical protein GMKNLPBB_02318 [Myxococcota bacterium]|nr:hypothetical protein [Myxococcota bacterium]
MNLIKLPGTATLALALALFALDAAAQNVKIAYVDLQAALSEVDEGRNAKAALKKDFDEKQKTLDKKQEELKKLKEEYDAQANLLTVDARRAKETELQKKFMELQQLYMKLQTELSKEEGRLTREIFGKMSIIAKEIAEKEGFVMIMEKTDTNIIYAKPGMNVTEQLVRLYNERYPSKAAAPKEGENKDAKPEPGKK